MARCRWIRLGTRRRDVRGRWPTTRLAASRTTRRELSRGVHARAHPPTRGEATETVAPLADRSSAEADAPLDSLVPRHRLPAMIHTPRRRYAQVPTPGAHP